jgi:capsular polysaccharide biosynthesis protein
MKELFRKNKSGIFNINTLHLLLKKLKVVVFDVSLRYLRKIAPEKIGGIDTLAFLKNLIRPYYVLLKKTTVSIRIFCIRPLLYLPISSEIIGPPKGVYQATKEYIATAKFGELCQLQNQIIFQEIHSRHQVFRSPPKTLDKKVHWKFIQEYECELPATFVAVLPNGRVWVNRGAVVDSSAVITPDDKLLADVSLEFGRTSNNHSIFTQLKLPNLRKINGIAALLTSAKGHIYFHWMFDILPRIELLRKSNIPIESIDNFIINNYSLSFQIETLTTLGISHQKILESSKLHHIKADKLLVPSLPSIPGNMPFWAIKFLRKEYLNNQITEKINRQERLYISRAKASYRRVIDETELSDFLSKFGFQSIVLESMSVAEQSLLFSSAKVVVAPHGAGLTNTVFCNPGTKVIELFSPNYVNVCYWSLSNQLGIEYYYLLGVGSKPPEYVDPHLAGENIRIDLISLSSILKLAGIK